MTISMGEIFVNCIWFKGKILEIQQKKGRCPIFGKIGREGGSASQNRETHYLWDRVDWYANNKDADQTAQMRMLICVVVVHI